MAGSTKARKLLHAGSMFRRGASISRVAQEVGLSLRQVCRLKRDPRIYDAALCAKNLRNGRPSKLSTKQQADVRLALLAKFSLSSIQLPALVASFAK